MNPTSQRTDAREQRPRRTARLRLSARYASELRKAEWLELYADDAILEDPVSLIALGSCGAWAPGSRGPESVLGSGHRSGEMTYAIRQSYPCGDECANVWTLTNILPGMWSSP